MKTRTNHSVPQLCCAVMICYLACATSSAGTIPKRMTYETQQLTNSFHTRNGLAPVVSNVLYVVDHTRAACPYSRNMPQESVDVAKICALQLLPYLVTPADSSAVTRVIHACAAQSGFNTELLRQCGRMLIETTFDIPGGTAILQGIVDDTKAPLDVRIKAANVLFDRSLLTGYDLMIEAFDGTNGTAHFAAENLLLLYKNYVGALKEADTNAAPQLRTSKGTPVNLREVVTHIKHKMRLPFVTNNIGIIGASEN